MTHVDSQNDQMAQINYQNDQMAHIDSQNDQMAHIESQNIFSRLMIPVFGLKGSRLRRLLIELFKWAIVLFYLI